MSTSSDVLSHDPETPELRRIRRISRPVVFLISIALALGVVLGLWLTVLLLYGSPTMYAGTTLERPHEGICVMAAPTARVCMPPVGHVVPAGPGVIPIARLSGNQRLLLAAFLLLPTTCVFLMGLQLRKLFSLYCRGIIFAAENAQRIKRFALWLMAAAAASNLAAWGFAAVLDAHGLFGADVPQTLVAGAMIYVIGYVMDLGRAADLERKGYI
jgi:hypothetical protein